MARTGVRLGRLGAAFAAVALVVAMAGRAVGGPAEAARTPDPKGGRGVVEVRYVVRSGDTLWEIARARVGPQADPRPMVDALRTANDLGTAPLQAGSSLVVPPAP